MASISEDCTLKIWSIKNDKPIQSIQTTKKKEFHSYSITSLSFHNTKQLIATGSLDKTFCLSNYKTGVIYSKSPKIGEIETICIGSCFDAVLIGTLDGLINLFDITKNILLSKYKHDCGIIKTKFWEKNRLFVSSTVEGDLIFNGSGKNKDYNVQPVIRGGYVHDFDFVDDNRIVIGGEDGVVYEMDVRKGLMDI